MPYTADATNVLTPADGDYVVNGPAEIRAIKVLLATATPLTQTLYITANTTLTAAQSGLTVLLSTGLLTLPAPSSPYIRFRVVGTGLGVGSFQTPSGSIYYPDTNPVAANTPISAGQVSTVDLLSDGTNWIVTSQAGDIIVKSSTTANRPARIDQVLGIGQTYQDMTASRFSGTPYYNGSTKPILVVAQTNNGAYYDATITATVGGVSFVVGRDNNSNGGTTGVGSVLVPAGTWYSLVASGPSVSGFAKWMELR